jgi:hypothetical protein
MTDRVDWERMRTRAETAEAKVAELTTQVEEMAGVEAILLDKLDEREKIIAAEAKMAKLEKELAIEHEPPNVTDLAMRITTVEKERDEMLAISNMLCRYVLELRQQVEDTIVVAQKDVDAENWIIAYHFKTGAINRLLAKARDALPFLTALSSAPQRTAAGAAKEVDILLCDNCKRAQDGRTNGGFPPGPCYCATLRKVAAQPTKDK